MQQLNMQSIKGSCVDVDPALRCCWVAASCRAAQAHWIELSGARRGRTCAEWGLVRGCWAASTADSVRCRSRDAVDNFTWLYSFICFCLHLRYLAWPVHEPLISSARWLGLHISAEGLGPAWAGMLSVDRLRVARLTWIIRKGASRVLALAISGMAPGICKPNCFRKAFSYLGLEIAGCCSPTAEVAALLTPSRAIWPITFAALTSFGVAPTISTSYICQHRATFVSQERGAGCSVRDCFQWRIGRMMCIDMKMTRASSILISVLSILELSGRMLYRSGRNLRVIAADKVGFR